MEPINDDSSSQGLEKDTTSNTEETTPPVVRKPPTGGVNFQGTFLPTNTGPKVNLQSGARMAGKQLVKTGLAADVAITGGLSYLTGESDNVAEAALAGATSLIPDAGGTAKTMDIGGKCIAVINQLT